MYFMKMLPLLNLTKGIMLQYDKNAGDFIL